MVQLDLEEQYDQPYGNYMSDGKIDRDWRYTFPYTPGLYFDDDQWDLFTYNETYSTDFEDL